MYKVSITKIYNLSHCFTQNIQIYVLEDKQRETKRNKELIFEYSIYIIIDLEIGLEMIYLAHIPPNSFPNNPLIPSAFGSHSEPQHTAPLGLKKRSK